MADLEAAKERAGGNPADVAAGEVKTGDRSHYRKNYHHKRFEGGPRYLAKRRNNEYEDLPETDDPNEIRAQVEFYFSNNNLRTDQHLFFLMRGPENKPVSIKHLHEFNRMRRFQPYSAVVAAIRGMQELEVVDSGDWSGPGNEGVKRKVPIEYPKRDLDRHYTPRLEEIFNRLCKQSRNKNIHASAYVKNFGDEEIGQIALERFFKPFGAVMVRKRRDEDGNWKGSVFVQFDKPDTQQQFCRLDPKPRYNDNELFIMTKMEYCEMKCKEKGIVPEWKRGPNERSGLPRRGGYGRGRAPHRSDGYRGHGYRGSDDWNERRDRFQRSDENHRRDRSQRSDENDRDDVSIVKDTRGEKRKADNSIDGENEGRKKAPKKSELEKRETDGLKRKAEDHEESDQASKKSKVEVRSNE